MTITIPVWLCWTLGIIIGVPLALFMGICMVIGFLMLSDWKWR
jgi:hypothetical protein